MNITGNTAQNELIDWANRLLNEIEDRADKSVIEGIQRAITSLQSDRFTVAVLGKAKRGKSTLLNVLLGRKDDTLAPVDKLPASSAVSRFRSSTKSIATVAFRDNSRQSIGFEQIRDYVTEESNPGNRLGVDVVEVEGPFAGLEGGVELVDTPGAASIHEHHDAILHAFIPQADVVIFLVSVRMPLDQDELDLLRQVKSADIRKIFFVINRVDEANEKDLSDAITHNRTLLSQIGINVDQIYRISAKRAFKGELENNGISELISAVSSFVSANRFKVANERFVSRVCDLIRPVAMSLELESVSCSKTSVELKEELSCLNEKKQQLESERKFAEREFKLKWDRALDELEFGLTRAKTNVEVELARSLNNISSFNLTQFSKELPSWLTQLIEEHLSPVSSKCEESIREACEKLQAIFPRIDLHDGGTISISTRTGSEVLTGSIGGLATAATGIGVATAGSSVAATIAAANIAAIQATSTVAAPSILSGILSLAGFEFLAPLATGTASVAAPAALTATPLWVALSGPVGWTLAGVGVLAIPFSWKLSKVRLKDKLDVASREHVDLVFTRVRSNRIPALRSMRKGIFDEFQMQLDRQIEQIELAINNAIKRTTSLNSQTGRDSFNEKLKRVQSLLDEVGTLLTSTSN